MAEGSSTMTPAPEFAQPSVTAVVTDAHAGELRVNLAEATCCVRREMLDGRERLVVPVVALNPGVLNDELVPATEVAASVLLWNDVPIPIEHPRERGMPISARTPAVLERTLAGRLYGAVQGPDGKLRGEMWLDSAKMTAMGYGGLLALLEVGGPVEVSTAYFRDFESAPGELAGKPYVGIARNLRPDHLALLPHSKGACSWEDGCGAPRVNEGERASGGTGARLSSAEPENGSNRDAAGDVARTTAHAARSVAIGSSTPAEASGPLGNGGKTVDEETKVEAETQPVAEVEAEPAVNELAGQLAAMVTEFGGAAALREALVGLRANQDAERAGLLAELQANGRATFTPEELAGWPTATLRKLADALRPVDAPAANYAGRGGPRGNESGGEWQVLVAPEVK